MSYQFGDFYSPINFKKEVEIGIQKELKSERKKKLYSQPKIKKLLVEDKIP